MLTTINKEKRQVSTVQSNRAYYLPTFPTHAFIFSLNNRTNLQSLTKFRWKNALPKHTWHVVSQYSGYVFVSEFNSSMSLKKFIKFSLNYVYIIIWQNKKYKKKSLFCFQSDTHLYVCLKVQHTSIFEYLSFVQPSDLPLFSNLLFYWGPAFPY